MVAQRSGKHSDLRIYQLVLHLGLFPHFFSLRIQKLLINRKWATVDDVKTNFMQANLRCQGMMRFSSHHVYVCVHVRGLICIIGFVSPLILIVVLCCRFFAKRHTFTQPHTGWKIKKVKLKASERTSFHFFQFAFRSRRIAS